MPDPRADHASFSQRTILRVRQNFKITRNENGTQEHHFPVSFVRNIFISKSDIAILGFKLNEKEDVFIYYKRILLKFFSLFRNETRKP